MFAVALAPRTLSALEWFGSTFEGTACTGNSQGHGPFDYFDADEPSDRQWDIGRWWEVRVIHAQPGLAAMNAQPFDQREYNRAAAEFDYVLRAFPNHPDILRAVIELEFVRTRAPERIYAYQTPPECYIQRGIAFRPDQPHLHQLMGLYLQRLGQIDGAIESYQGALELDPRSSEIHYNLGLAYTQKKDYERAMHHARVAYDLGFPLPGLRNRLRALGVWKDAPAAGSNPSVN
jgi:tetratricopeptide (TPR) repeat protein